MENERYVKWNHVKELIKLIKVRDSYMDWTDSYEKNDKKVKNTIEWLERNAKDLTEVKEQGKQEMLDFLDS